MLTIHDMIQLLLVFTMLVIVLCMSIAVYACISIAIERWPLMKRNNKMGIRAKSDVRTVAGAGVFFFAAAVAVAWMLVQCMADWGYLGWV